MTEHRRCGCPEQYKGRDCPACRGTGLIPPVTREEWEQAEAEFADIRASYQQSIDSSCPDEQHCTCVPALKEEIKRLATERDKYDRQGPPGGEVSDHIRTLRMYAESSKASPRIYSAIRAVLEQNARLEAEAKQRHQNVVAAAARR